MNDSGLAFEVVVVGGGPAGMGAACAAAESGAAVALVDDTPWLGGQIWRGQESGSANSVARQWRARFEKAGATLLSGTTVIAAPHPGVLLAEQSQRPCQIRWQRLILATGARELFLPFPGWTLPGVVGPGGLLTLAKHGWPARDRRVLVAGSGPLLLAVAEGLRRHGARVIAVAEQASRSRVFCFGLRLFAHRKLGQAVRLKLGLLGVPYRCGTWVVRADGDDQVRNVTLTNGVETWREECDLLACGFGLVPNVELPIALGCELQNGFVRVDSRQTTTMPNVYCAGEPTGIAGAEAALVQGQIAGYVAAGRESAAKELFAERDAGQRFRDALACAFALRPELKNLADDQTLLCRCEDVKLGRVRQFSSWREAKLQTRCGMGACQGRVCGAAAKVLLGWEFDSVRPPVLPVLVGSLISQSQTQQPKPVTAPEETQSQLAKTDQSESSTRLFAGA